MFDEKTLNQREQEKRKLFIEVLDKGLLGLNKAGILASLLRDSREGRGHCGCDNVCSGCKLKCGGCHLEA